MAQQRYLTIAEQRAATLRLRWLTLEAPELARAVRAGQYLMVRCAEEGSYDPLLRLLGGQPDLDSKVITTLSKVARSDRDLQIQILKKILSHFRPGEPEPKLFCIVEAVGRIGNPKTDGFIKGCLKHPLDRRAEQFVVVHHMDSRKLPFLETQMFGHRPLMPLFPPVPERLAGPARAGPAVCRALAQTAQPDPA